MGPTSLKLARGLKGLNRAPKSLIHTGMGRSSSSESGRWGKPQGSTNSMCFTLWGGKKFKNKQVQKISPLWFYEKKIPIKYLFKVLNWVLYMNMKQVVLKKNATFRHKLQEDELWVPKRWVSGFITAGLSWANYLWVCSLSYTRAPWRYKAHINGALMPQITLIHI